MVNAEKLDWLNLPEGSTQVPRNPENAGQAVLVLGVMGGASAGDSFCHQSGVP